MEQGFLLWAYPVRENYHGIYEYLNLNSFKKMIPVLLGICREMIGKKG